MTATHAAEAVPTWDPAGDASGEFVDRDGERWYVIRQYDAMPPFFISVISDSDHWMFISSSGGLTAGRVSPQTALFPYITVDRVHESAPHTGSKTLIRAAMAGGEVLWEPFNREHDDRFRTTRNLYKNLLGNKLRFEEINHDLQLAFRYQWCNSDRYGFVRHCELRNLGDGDVSLNFLDGLQNLLPAGTPKVSQDMTSNLLDAYKWSELDATTGLGIYTLFSALSDRAEPAESLRASTVFCLGLEPLHTLLSTTQLASFRQTGKLLTEAHRRGLRGAYMVHGARSLAAGSALSWQLVCGMEQSQGDVVSLQRELKDPGAVEAALAANVKAGTDNLARTMAASDCQQATAEEPVTVHHLANVIFNVLRGGIFDDQYGISRDYFCASVRHFNRDVYNRHRTLLEELPPSIPLHALQEAVNATGDGQLERLCLEYLPITFGRRHGDPSRPWNMFAINVKNADGSKRLAYEGNWRDIFQNWEGLALSYPDFVESVIAKFVNASTPDGYNPYRITSDGIDWEVQDPDDPWSYIGYWGDHQIIYLQKLLELSRNHHPQQLSALLRRRIFAYANVPYRIKPFGALIEDPKHTVTFDTDAAALIDDRVATLGADGKLVLDGDGQVVLVGLMEKLLVPLLAKLGNLVIGGGIWMNTQRPEWNDANNALVGNGLSMVTLYYLRRYLLMLSDLVSQESEGFEFSSEVARWLNETSAALHANIARIAEGPLSGGDRFAMLRTLGTIASEYRAQVYGSQSLAEREHVTVEQLQTLLALAMDAIDLTISRNRRDDGLYHAYNLLKIEAEEASVLRLYAMLEGQVAAISSGSLDTTETIRVLDALFASDIYRRDQKTFMLYPDRPLSTFLEKNQVDGEAVMAIPLLARCLESGDSRLVYRDAAGVCRFNADFRNVGDLREQLRQLASESDREVDDEERQAIENLYEDTFNHRAFTGRSGGMFGFEGLGCIYWHMVSKLLLAAQEAFYRAVDEGADPESTERLAALYYRIREGIGFNKSPAEYGAFPLDPYSHTPGHAGAQQPGMTGQVKEELLTRFGELGLRIQGGQARFEPVLLRPQEFRESASQFHYLDTAGEWRTADLPAGSLAFTWCQVPCVYTLRDGVEGGALRVSLSSGEVREIDGSVLPEDLSAAVFRRSGEITRLELTLPPGALYGAV